MQLHYDNGHICGQFLHNQCSTFFVPPFNRKPRFMRKQCYHLFLSYRDFFFCSRWRFFIEKNFLPTFSTCICYTIFWTHRKCIDYVSKDLLFVSKYTRFVVLTIAWTFYWLVCVKIHVSKLFLDKRSCFSKLFSRIFTVFQSNSNHFGLSTLIENSLIEFETKPKKSTDKYWQSNSQEMLHFVFFFSWNFIFKSKLLFFNNPW